MDYQRVMDAIAHWREEIAPWVIVGNLVTGPDVSLPRTAVATMLDVIEAAVTLRSATETFGADEYTAEQSLDATLLRFVEQED